MGKGGTAQKGNSHTHEKTATSGRPVGFIGVGFRGTGKKIHVVSKKTKRGIVAVPGAKGTKGEGGHSRKEPRGAGMVRQEGGQT